MGIDEPEKHDGFTKIGKEDWAEIEKLAEAWVAGLPFEAIYQVAKRFHVHLLTMMFCEDKDYFEEIKRDHEANLLNIRSHSSIFLRNTGSFFSNLRPIAHH